MLQCLYMKSSSSSTSSPAAAAAPAAAVPNIHPHSPPPPQSQGGTSSEASPSATLSHEYSLAVQSTSYNEIWSKIHQDDHRPLHHHHHDDNDNHDEVEVEAEADEEENHHHYQQRQSQSQRQQLLLGQVLQPNRECVEEALRHAKPNSLTRLVSDYFEQSENTTHACLKLLHRSVHRARLLYAPLHQLLDVFVVDSFSSLSQSQCSQALQVFVQFDRHDNPFPSPDDSDSHNFDDMRRCFSQLKLQLDTRLRSSRSRVRLLRRATLASALCIFGTAVGVAVSAVAITVHALTAALVVVAGPPLCCSTASASGDDNDTGGSCCTCSSTMLMTATEKKEVGRMKQLDAAAMGTCVLDNDLATIDRLVRRLHTAVQGNKLLVRLGLERGSANGTDTAIDKHPIQEVLKQLSKDPPNFLQLLEELEEHICLCFNTVNRARSLLLHHIYTQ